MFEETRAIDEREPLPPKRESPARCCAIGSPSRTRTYNPPVNSRMLYH
jgi:hypothetical protein